MNFIHWYKKKLKTLYNDPICSFLKNKRDISIHRQEITPVVTRGINYGMDVLIGRPEDFKNLRELESRKETTTKSITFGWFFDDYPGQDALSMCEHYFGKMKGFVEEARETFPV